MRIKLTGHFYEDEFYSPDVERQWMKPLFMDRLELARRKADTPFVITSGCRTPAHNTLVGGEVYSAHLDGWAGDIAIVNNLQRALIWMALYDAGFRRFGIAKTFLHADCHPDKPTPRIWTYDHGQRTTLPIHPSP